MYLDDDFVGVEALRLPLDVALDVVVTHLDGELDLVLDVDDAAVRVVLGVDLAVEDLVRPTEDTLELDPKTGTNIALFPNTIHI